MMLLSDSMFKNLAVLLLLLLWGSISYTQISVEVLKNKLRSERNDTSMLLWYEQIANIYSEINPDSAFHYAEQALAKALQLRLKLEEVVALGELGYAQLNLGNYPRSLQHLLSAISIAEDPGSEKNILPVKFSAPDDYTDRSVSAQKQRLTKLSRIQQYCAILYGNSGNPEKALNYYSTAIPLAEEANNVRILSIIYTTLGRTLFTLKRLDTALVCLKKAYDFSIRSEYPRYQGSILLNIARVHLGMGNIQTAKDYFHLALKESAAHDYFRGIVASHLALSDLYKQESKKDSSLYHIQLGLSIAKVLNAPDLLLRCYTASADYYQNAGLNDSTVKYQSLIIKLNENRINSKQIQQFQNIDFDAKQKLLDAQAKENQFRNQLQKYALLAGMLLFIMATTFFWRSSLQRQKSNALLQNKNIEIQNTLSQLKATQAQLIQSEKMASLGELTAGIAHEIQNPLNFVNNFSELNNELIKELKNEVDAGNTNEVKVIAKDIEANSEKINHHGKRAESIVKGMLEHSRKSSGLKEPTDVNKLCDEFVRLSYHGLRAKDNSFKCDFKLDPDPSLPLVNVVSQDIGRVILNIVNNAFQACAEKQQFLNNNGNSIKNQRNNDQAPDSPSGGAGKKNSKDNSLLPPTPEEEQNFVYHPVVSISTKIQGNKIEIRISDNGPGIPENIKDKIFQPFFTTKPTGQGTGLGLSLAYDIVKAHGGEIKVNSKVGIGTEFTIQLPV